MTPRRVGPPQVYILILGLGLGSSWCVANVVSVALDLGYRPDLGAQRDKRNKRTQFSRGPRALRVVPEHVCVNQPRNETPVYSPPRSRNGSKCLIEGTRKWGRDSSERSQKLENPAGT